MWNASLSVPTNYIFIDLQNLNDNFCCSDIIKTYDRSHDYYLKSDTLTHPRQIIQQIIKIHAK